MSKKEQDVYGNRLLFVILLAFSFIILIIHSGKSVRLYKNILYHIIRPTSISLNNMVTQARNVNNRWNDFISTYLINENIKNEFEQLKDYKVKFEEDEKEIRKLKYLLNIKDSINKEFLPVEVISRDWFQWYQTIIINKGLNDGINIKTPILRNIGSKYYLVGRVIESYKDYSKVILITDINFSLYSKSNKSNFDGLLVGQNSPILIFKYLDLNSKLEMGEEIYTSSFDLLGFPEVYIGEVVSGPQIENGFLYFKIKPKINFSKMDNLIALK